MKSDDARNKFHLHVGLVSRNTNIYHLPCTVLRSEIITCAGALTRIIKHDRGSRVI